MAVSPSPLFCSVRKKYEKQTAVRTTKTVQVTALSFFGGGVIGAFGFKHLGYVSTVPLALVLVGLAGVPAIDDLLMLGRQWQLEWRARGRR